MPEIRLILSLARDRFKGDLRPKSAALLTKPLNWKLILELVTAEQVYPLFSRNLEKLLSIEHGEGSRKLEVRREALNAKRNATNAERNNATNAIHATDALARLRSLAKINAFRSALLTEELARVLKLFAAAEIPAIPLKGPALAQMLYGDPSLRTYTDLDILVPRSSVRHAFDLLRTDGYKSEFGPGFFANLLLRHNIEYSLRRRDHGFDFMVELHWGVSWGGKAEQNIADQLWVDTYPTIVFGAAAYALKTEWQILVLVAHAARHQWQGLKWLVDLHELFSSPGVDWDELGRKGKQLGWNELVRISFLACHSLFDTAIPEKYLVGELPAWVKLFPAVAPVRLNGAFFPTRLLQRRLDKLRYAGRVLLIPTLAELRVVKLFSALAFLYYPLRPLRLMYKWGWGFLAQGMRQVANRLPSIAGIGIELLDWDWLLDLTQ